jgi:tetratricopeptide (TPR) repeat protein
MRGSHIIPNIPLHPQHNQQEMDDALTLYKEVLKQVEAIGSSWLYVDTSIQLSLLYTKLGDYSSATELLTRTIELAEQLGYKKGAIEAMKCLAQVDFEQQQYGLAIQLYKECLKTRELVTKVRSEKKCGKLIGL